MDVSRFREPGDDTNISYYKALYDYAPQRDDEVALVEGAMVYVLRKLDDNWWRGVCNNKAGVFPATYVEKTSAPASSPGNPSVGKAGGKQYLKAIFDYADETTDNLSIKEGDVFELIADAEEGWTKVARVPGGEQGFIPTSYVEPTSAPANISAPPPASKPLPSPPASSKKPTIAATASKPQLAGKPSLGKPSTPIKPKPSIKKPSTTSGNKPQAASKPLTKPSPGVKPTASLKSKPPQTKPPTPGGKPPTIDGKPSTLTVGSKPKVVPGSKPTTMPKGPVKKPSNSTSPDTGDSQAAAERDQYRKELQQVNSNLSQVQARITAAKKELATLETEKTKLTTDLANQQKQSKTVASSKASLQADIKLAEGNLAQILALSDRKRKGGR
eukprot:m.145894 g.145894  ORF g.145894 m.145894 type:complete len:386 (-) comp24289_c1_seq2:1264-2421(-)